MTQLLLLFLPLLLAEMVRAEMVLFTVATEQTDGYLRWRRTAEHYSLQNINVLGLGEKWTGGDIARVAGGGMKVNLFRKGILPYCDDEKTVILFTDSYDVLFSAGEKDILDAFHSYNAKILFSAEPFCWPKSELADTYPPVKVNEQRFLNSGGFIGYGKQLCELVKEGAIQDTDDDQLFYTKIFLDPVRREKLGMKLDTKSVLFHNLHGTIDDLDLKFEGKKSYLYNSKTGSLPKIIHGNGPIKSVFNKMADYLADAWTLEGGCAICEDKTIDLTGTADAQLPTVFVGFFVEWATPFLNHTLEHFLALTYPKSRMTLYIHNAIPFHSERMSKFVEVANAAGYSQVIYKNEELGMTEKDARNDFLSMNDFLEHEYLFSLDSIAVLTQPKTLQILISQNRSIITPLLSRPGELWSNFWGAISSEGYYSRSTDYSDIVKRRYLGVWNVPFVNSAVLMNASRVAQMKDPYSFGPHDADMAFCEYVREKGMFMYVTNLWEFGHLINADNFNIENTRPDMWQLYDNRLDWETKYIHPDYWKVREGQPIYNGSFFKEPCQDVYWIPIVTEAWTSDLITIMETFGDWSGGKDKHEDKRLDGGYENVPTVDIHMNQVGYEPEWLQMLKDYIAPLANMLFTGYESEAKSHMNFVVRYHPDEQPFLRPHFDSSSYTINIALNKPGVDFQGGGCRFIRKNCSVTSTEVGWMLMHPGRLTHWHEGLPTTAGVRYIMVSFIDP